MAQFDLEPKQYQKQALDALTAFLQAVRAASAVHGVLDEAALNTAFAETVAAFDPAIKSGAMRPKKYQNTYQQVPNVCLRIPTGGGKTLLGAHAIERCATHYLGTATPFVIWLVHSDAILSQTLGALSNPLHPYRQTLDALYAGRVKVCCMDNLAQVRAADFRNHAVVLVATVQTFRIHQDKQHLRTVYEFDEAYADHFSVVPESLANLLLTVTPEDIKPDGPLVAGDVGRVKHCVANLMRLLRPIVIVDESHNFYSPQTVQTLKDFWPQVIVELTATPKEKFSNVLFAVSALALKTEHMIKLPIVLANHAGGWQSAVDDALLTRQRLENLAVNELPDYIRPLILFQAEPVNKTATVEVLKKYLREEKNIPENQIAVQTSKEKGLGNLNLFDPQCSVLFVITVEALKEGWDCSFAYVLCSLQDVGSTQDAEQLLGRVLRMPYARERKEPDLNKAYAHIVSKHFDRTVEKLRDNLVQKLGFEKAMLGAAIAPHTPLPLFDDPLPETATQLRGLFASEFLLTQAPLVSALPLEDAARVTVNAVAGGVQVTVHGAITQAIRGELTRNTAPEQAPALEKAMTLHNQMHMAQSAPSQTGEIFPPVPQLCLQLADGATRWEVVQPEVLQHLCKWTLPLQGITLNGYQPIDSTQAQAIDISRVSQTLTIAHYNYQQLALNAIPSTATESDLIRYLDGVVQQEDLLPDVTLAFVGGVVRHLRETRGFSLTALERDKVRLANAVIAQIADYRNRADQAQFTLSFDDMRNSATLDAPHRFCFAFSPTGYPHATCLRVHGRSPNITTQSFTICAGRPMQARLPRSLIAPALLTNTRWLHGGFGTLRSRKSFHSGCHWRRAGSILILSRTSRTDVCWSLNIRARNCTNH
jgi:type III restriction enzyme